MKRALLVLLVACADVDTPSALYECKATFICDGGRYEVVPQSTCAENAAEAQAYWQVALDKIAEQALCTDESFEASCKFKGLFCGAL